jgi:hypothetical protein
MPTYGYSDGFDEFVDEVIGDVAFDVFEESEVDLAGGHQRRQQRVRARRHRAVEPRQSQREQREQQMARTLKEEHPYLHPDVARAAVRGAQNVKGAGGQGADVVLRDGRGREVSVLGPHTPLSSLYSRVLAESPQAGPRGEIWMQVTTPGATPEQVRQALSELAVESPRLVGQSVRVFGPQGQLLYRRSIPVRGSQQFDSFVDIEDLLSGLDSFTEEFNGIDSRFDGEKGRRLR